MNDPSKDDGHSKKLVKQGSLSHIEQTLNMISTPHEGPVTIYPAPKSGLRNMSKVRVN